MLPTEVHLRRAHPYELQRVLDYCKTHDHPNFAIRERETEQSISRGGVYVLEVEGQLVGTSSNFLLSGNGSCWMEIGQSRISLNGLGLYRAMICVQVIDALLDWPAINFVFAQVDEGNDKVSDMFASMSFRRFKPPPELEEACIGTLPFHKRPSALGYGFVWWKVEDKIPQPFQAQLAAFTSGFVRSSGGKYSLVLDHCLGVDCSER